MSEDGNEDSWLYGSEDMMTTEINLTSINTEQAQNENEQTKQNLQLFQSPNIIEEDPAMEMEEEQENTQNTNDNQTVLNENLESDDEYTDESEDDDINIVIGQIKTGPLYPKQRQNFLVPNPINQAEKKQMTGKFNIEEFESLGSINGVSVQEFSIDSLDEKPWRKPGADITDYFNYGFNEDTWRAYCEKQKRVRINESGVGLQTLTAQTSLPIYSQSPYSLPQGQTPQVIASNSFVSVNRTLTTVSNSDKFSVQNRCRGSFSNSQQISRENSIQVMTAECRDYSKANYNNSHDENYFESDTYDYGFEPTQDLQWLNQVNKAWQPTEIKELTFDSTTIPNTNSCVATTHPQLFANMQSSGICTTGKNLMLPPKVSVTSSNREWNKDFDRDNKREIRVRERDKEKEIRERDVGFVKQKFEKEHSRDRLKLDENKRINDKNREKKKEAFEESEKTDENREKRRRDRIKERDRERSLRTDDRRSRDKSKGRSRSYEKNFERKEKRDRKRGTKVEMHN